jgi:hypothetical protein
MYLLCTAHNGRGCPKGTLVIQGFLSGRITFNLVNGEEWQTQVLGKADQDTNGLYDAVDRRDILLVPGGWFGYCFQTLMEYHLKLFDVRVGAKWIHKTKIHWELSRNDPGDLARKLKGRVRGSPDLLNEVLGIRRKIIRYNKGRGVPIYYIRLPQVHSFIIVNFPI